MKQRSTLLLAAAPLLSFPAHACLNDRDSDALALQAQKLPETVRVITGRFERNPPLYYQMRVDRVKKELAANPHQWGLYDDIAVALDRLHRDDEALVWIEKKRAQLPKYNKSNPQVKEAWYRYYANTGTFRAHRWLQNGAKKESSAELVQARREIQRAIEIKPDAHFGREKYQLMVMGWLWAVKTKNTKDSLGSYLHTADDWEWAYNQPSEKLARRNRAIEGLTGLIVLGAAWESVDIFYALASALDQKNSAGLSVMALMRSEELLKSGKRSLVSTTNDAGFIGALIEHPAISSWTYGVNKTNLESLRKLYPELRAEADLWAANRMAFMNKQLKAGQHPDTHSGFWDSYKGTAAPSLDINWTTQEELNNPNKGRNQFLIVSFLLLAAAFIGVKIRQFLFNAPLKRAS